MIRYRGISLLLVAASLVFLFYPVSAHSQSLMSVIKNHSNLSAFANALESSGLDKKLEEQGPYTVFAPANSYFEKEMAGKNPSSVSVRNMLMNHIITGYASERNMKIMSKAKTLGGITLAMKANGDTITINNIELTNANLKAQNGVLHIIGGVLK